MTRRGSSDRVRRAALWAVPVLAAVVAVLVVTLPPVEQLGRLVRLVVFHGASTWVNLATFTLAGLAGAAFLATGSRRACAWASGFRWFSAPHWLVNTALGVLSARLAWGNVDFAEPRLRMSFWVLFGAAVVVGADLALERPKLSAALDAALAVALWAGVSLSPNVIHPDNPVLNSDWYIKAPFFGMVAGILGIALISSWLLRGRALAREELQGDEPPARNAA